MANLTRPAGSTARDHRTRVLVALMLTMALIAMDTTIVATAVPQVVGDLGGFSLVGWVFSVYLLAQTVTIPVYGKLADAYGRKPVLVVGVLVFLLGSSLSAAAWDMSSLIAFRALQGLGAGSIGATVNTLAGDVYDTEERGKMQGWLSSVWGISAVTAPALGGIFAQYAARSSPAVTGLWLRRRSCGRRCTRRRTRCSSACSRRARSRSSCYWQSSLVDSPPRRPHASHHAGEVRARI